jgi:LPXTG-motif cell wall-anchored protein
MRRRSLRRLGIFGLGVGVGLSVLVGAAAAEPDEDNPSSAKYECSDSHHSDTDHGANNDDGYQSTCDETDFGGNGQEDGPGNQTGKPCAGCVGNADDKNPPGQLPGPEDENSGYECDDNEGVGQGNPAHSGCTAVPPPPPPPPPPCVVNCGPGTVGEEEPPPGEEEPPGTGGEHVPPSDEEPDDPDDGTEETDPDDGTEGTDPDDGTEETDPVDQPALPKTGADASGTLASLGLGMLLAGVALRSTTVVRTRRR